MRTAVRAGEDEVVEGALVVGYLALVVGILAAYTSPASGYELSLYGSTPIVFWAALLVVAVVSVAVALSDGRYLPLAVLLGGLGAAAFVGLPLVRGYHFYGRADSLVHLGWARSINVGNDPLRLFYPGNHLTSVVLSKVAAIEITRAMMLVVWLYALVFFVGVALCVWFFVPDRRALAIGAFSAFLLLPINNVSTHMHFHTYSMAMLFVPFVLYLTFTHLSEGESRGRVPRRIGDGGGAVGRGSWGVSSALENGLGAVSLVPTSVFLPLVSFALILFHPQVALNVIILFIGISAAQLWYRRYRPGHPLAGYRPLALQTAFLGLLFVVWIVTHEWAFVRTAETMFESVVNFVSGTATTTPRVDSQTDSAASIGVSVWELFVKLFGVGAVFALLAAGVVLGRVSGYLGRLDEGRSMRTTPDTARNVTTLFFAGTLALLPFFALHFLGSISTYLFRHVGFLMMFATIFGAVGVRYLVSDEPLLTETRRQPVRERLRAVGARLNVSGPSGRSVATVVIIVLVLSLSIATVFPSPFVYLSGSHVPEGEMDGYERAFASQSSGGPVWFGGVRHTSDRYEQALYGAESAPWERQVTPPPKKSAPVPEEAMLNSLTTFYATHPEKVVRRDHYFVVTKADREREVGAYNELRYSAESFEAVEAQPDVGKVRDNGELTLYFVDISTDGATNGTDGGT